MVKGPCCLGHRVLVSEVRMHQCSNFLRALTQIDNPFVKPCRFQRTGCHFRDAARGIHRTALWAAKRAEAVLTWRADIRVTWVGRCPYPREDQTGDKVCLMERVDVRIGRHVPTHAHVAENWIELEAE